MTTTAHYDNDALIVTLFHHGTEIATSFADHRVSVVKTNDAYVMRTLGLTTPFESDGFIHFLWAVEEGGGDSEFAVRVSAEEAAVLPSIMSDARRAWVAAKKRVAE